MDIDTQGVKAVKKVEDFPQPLYIFLKPPSLKVLEERLRSRGTENEESLKKVFWYFLKFLDQSNSIINFSYITVNIAVT